MRIVVDAMGSDHFPVADVGGAVLAVQEYPNLEIILVGTESLIQQQLLEKKATNLPIKIVHADAYVTMEDKPSKVVRGKLNASMNVGMELVRDGKADAIVSMGNTGAFLAYSLRTLKRIKNVYRPAFPTIIPSRTGHFFISDSGANADCKPEWLVQFGIMTSIYAEQVLGIHNPRVGLLSNGEEEGKGNELTRLTRDLMEEADFNFIGNVEPKEALGGGVDVMITDGFTGNIVLKTLEAAARSMSELIKEEIMASTLTKVGGFLATPAFNRVRKKTDPFEIGGAPMLGVNGVVIAGHGRSNDIAIKNAINQAQKAVQSGVIDAITEKMSTWDKSQHKSSDEES